jgi:hypothetical protein
VAILGEFHESSDFTCGPCPAHDHVEDPARAWSRHLGTPMRAANSLRWGLTEATAGKITEQTGAGVKPECVAGNQGEIADPLLNDASTPEGHAYARAFSDTAAAHVKQLRECDPLPEPDRTPGTPHPDPVLANRGWHVNEHGIYTRRPKPQAAPRPDKDLEAG